MNTRHLIDTWSLLEDKNDDVFIILQNTNKKTVYTDVVKIIVSNKNDMKYLDVYLNDSSCVYGSYTHIHSFVNDMISTYSDKLFMDLTVTNINGKTKRKLDNENTGYHDDNIKRLKYE